MNQQEWKLPLMNSYIEKWAREIPQRAAIIQHENGRSYSYQEMDRTVDFLALKLLEKGIGFGDRVATMLPMLAEHVFLMYACFKVGAIIAPLDLRLQPQEVVRDLGKIEPKAFFFLGKTPLRDFREVGEAVRDNCPSVELLVQFSSDPSAEELVGGAVSAASLQEPPAVPASMLQEVYNQVDTRTPALIIFTTGTTGEPKPAVLCHENVIIQNRVLGLGIGLEGEDMSMLVNLPPSHVGGVTEQLMTTLFMGGTAVLLRIFDPRMSLEAVEKHRLTVLGQIPTQFRMQWVLPDYGEFDLSSLQFAIYGGAGVDSAFLKKLSEMAPYFGTGMGMSETAGMYTFTPKEISVEEMAGQVGASIEELATVTIRKTMREDGYAGDTLPDGAVGEICVKGPIVFLGYYRQPEETAKNISQDGVLYTGDVGYFKEMGTYRALYLAGRRKFVIKQKGYQVFPDEVQEYIASHPGVEQVEVVGMPHNIFDDGIFAFVKPKEGIDLTPEEIQEYCKKGIASYKRPQHVEIWPREKDFPLTRVTKVDKMQLKEMALPVIERLRKEGKWDAG
ncbi:class I adenylate-forming enzyme family protein [Dethiobacter alkaliphilus]|uniref:AMP-dependent synthetase and ligase n=1 Tax=Dethiobacter alkaliphilus AHT 1 TaxID=555088 RepID=C0GD58_DETAL|nr:class I adenylate-forming enzyme family protein [Dethiobacter alkaliphilus]EEG79143.1 AMP-dependent synthetase and ligase [Dethiobacter alkaliphilus AHT 1]